MPLLKCCAHAPATTEGAARVVATDTGLQVQTETHAQHQQCSGCLHLTCQTHLAVLVLSIAAHIWTLLLAGRGKCQPPNMRVEPGIAGQTITPPMLLCLYCRMRAGQNRLCLVQQVKRTLCSAASLVCKNNPGSRCHRQQFLLWCSAGVSWQ